MRGDHHHGGDEPASGGHSTPASCGSASSVRLRRSARPASARLGPARLVRLRLRRFAQRRPSTARRSDHRQLDRRNDRRIDRQERCRRTGVDASTPPPGDRRRVEPADAQREQQPQQQLSDQRQGPRRIGVVAQRGRTRWRRCRSPSLLRTPAGEGRLDRRRPSSSARRPRLRW